MAVLAILNSSFWSDVNVTILFVLIQLHLVLSYTIMTSYDGRILNKQKIPTVLERDCFWSFVATRCPALSVPNGLTH